MRAAIRLAGGSLLVLGLLPFHRLLAGVPGPAASTFHAWGTGYAPNALAACLAVALLGALLLPVVGRLSGRLETTEVRTPPARADALAWGAGVAGALAAWAFAAVVLSGGPLLVDGVVQIVQGTLLASGRVGIPPEVPVSFFHFQYLAPSSAGWTSQYPPGHAAFLALGHVLGAPALVGPLLHGVTAWLGVRVARRLLPEGGVGLWVGAALLALSPLAVAPAGSYMSHTPAALLALAAVAAALRWGEGGGLRWGLAAGGALGALACVRPYTALYTTIPALMVPWLRPGRSPRDVMRYVGALGAGALPGVAVLMAVNAALFGGALTFGYEAAQGPGHGLGFHTDPWGVPYTPKLALAYAVTELQAAGVELAGVPLPLTPLIGLALLAGAVRGGGARLLLTWALAPVLAGFLYWHHDLSMGPRLISDAAPAWALLAGWSAGGLATPGRWTAYRRSLLVGAVLLAGVYAPMRLAGYRGRTMATAVPEGTPAVSDPSLVFVHGSWEGRLGARLAERGTREDALRRILGGYTSCQIQRYLDDADARGDSGAAPPDPGPEAARGRGLLERRMPSGSVVRTYEGEELTRACRRQAESDFRGILGLPDVIWRGGVPGAEGDGPMYLRDMGPDRNPIALSAYPDRQAWLLAPLEPGGIPMLLPYAEGMARLWPGDGTSP